MPHQIERIRIVQVRPATFSRDLRRERIEGETAPAEGGDVLDRLEHVRGPAVDWDLEPYVEHAAGHRVVGRRERGAVGREATPAGSMTRRRRVSHLLAHVEPDESTARPPLVQVV